MPPGDLAVISHFAERCRLDGGLQSWIDYFDSGQDRDFRVFNPKRVCQFDSVLYDVNLVFQRWEDIDRAIGDDQRPGIGRDVKDKPMAGSPCRTKAGCLPDDCSHQFVSAPMSASSLSLRRLANQRNRHICGSVAVLRFNHLVGCDVKTGGLCDRKDLIRRPDQDRRDDACDRACKRGRVARMRHCCEWGAASTPSFPKDAETFLRPAVHCDYLPKLPMDR
jgi:hypothetical protein